MSISSEEAKKCSGEYHDELLARGELHAAFDIDGTLLPQVFPKWADPYPWVKPLFETLKKHDCTIWIYSARFNMDFYPTMSDVWFTECCEWLRKHDLDKYVRITRYKPPADVIFDDRGCRLEGSDVTDLRAAMNTISIKKWQAGYEIKWPEELYRFIRNETMHDAWAESTVDED